MVPFALWQVVLTWNVLAPTFPGCVRAKRYIQSKDDPDASHATPRGLNFGLTSTHCIQSGDKRPRSHEVNEADPEGTDERSPTPDSVLETF